MDLFSQANPDINDKNLPLAVRMRPANLDQLVGQEQILGKNKLLRRAIEADRLSSVILFGPPGTGKTSLAWCIARVTQSDYVAINATTSNVEELRKVIAASKLRIREGKKKVILFIDDSRIRIFL